MGRPTSSYFSGQVDALVKAFLVSDALLYSALNIVTVFFAVYASTQVTGGSLATAGWSLSFGYVSRIATELVFARLVSKQSERTKVLTIICGMLLISAAYLALALATRVQWLYVWWIVGGLGWGLALPTKLAVVSGRIDRQQSNQEWGLNDAMNMALIAASTAACGAAAATLGIRPLLSLAAALNLLGALPYVLFLGRRPKQQLITAAVEVPSERLS